MHNAHATTTKQTHNALSSNLRVKQGGEIIQIDTLLACGLAQTTLVYVIHYEAARVIA